MLDNKKHNNIIVYMSLSIGSHIATLILYGFGILIWASLMMTIIFLLAGMRELVW